MPIDFGTLLPSEQAMWGTQVHNAMSDLPEEYSRILKPLAAGGMGPGMLGQLLAKLMDEQRQAAQLEEAGRQADQKEAVDIFKTRQTTDAQRDITLGNVLGGKYQAQVAAAKERAQGDMFREADRQRAADERARQDRISREGIAQGQQALGKERLDVMRNPPMQQRLDVNTVATAKNVLARMYAGQTGQDLPPELAPFLDELVVPYLAYRNSPEAKSGTAMSFNVAQELARRGRVAPPPKPGLFG